MTTLRVSKIKRSYEKAIGRTVPKPTVYRMLDRHGWRKISPRPRHPKADKENKRLLKKLPEIIKNEAAKHDIQRKNNTPYVSG